jgi:protein-tyrosine-phosphatase
MAEALTRARFGDASRVSSAGLRPQPPADAQAAINILRFEFQIDASHHIPRSVKAVDLDEFDIIVAMDKYVAKELKALTPREIVTWNIHDPFGSGDEYKPCADSIFRKLLLFQAECRRRGLLQP